MRTVIAAGILVAAGWIARSSAQAPVPSLDDRIAGCPVCARMVEEVPAEEFAEDPHTFACGTCHHPHTRRTADEWRRTCQAGGCHPRAWPKTRFHRIRPEVFGRCQNCHAPHVFRPAGTDCADCHDAGPADPVPAPSVAGVETFPHRRHGSIPCADCHASPARHAGMRLADVSECTECHHGQAAESGCIACHAPDETRGARRIPLRLGFSVWEEPRERTLVFDHARHRELECAACHASDRSRALDRNCGDCHGEHHRTESDCTACHRPPPDGAHALAVHETRSCDAAGCHDGGFPRMPLQRNFCLSCHQDQTDHNPGRNCAACHKLQPEPVDLP